MRKIIFCLLGFLGTGAWVYGADDPLQNFNKSLKDQAFVVETDEDSRSESLNRISGQIDLGFTLPDQTYESSSHYRPGPFGREEIKDKTSQGY